MHTLNVHLGAHSYPIYFYGFNLAHTVKVIQKNTKEPRVFIITNRKLKNRYTQTITAAWQAQLQIIWIVVPDGEHHKNLKTIETVLTRLSLLGATRQSLIVALGGGVVTDIAGLTAALYMRGIAFLSLPTSLLAQVDAAIGGKNGVDLTTGKNLAGTFYQPRAVCVQTAFITSLPEREYRAGLAEVLKYAFITHTSLLDFITKNQRKLRARHAATLLHVIQECCRIKIQFVERDEKDNGIRQHLNFGHTLGHAIEVLSGFRGINHGEAVAMGMVFAAELSHKLGFTDATTRTKIVETLKSFDLPTTRPAFSPRSYLKVMLKDKKTTHDSIRFILPKKNGKVAAITVAKKDVLACLKK